LIALLPALAAAGGAYLVYSEFVLGRRGLRAARTAEDRRRAKQRYTARRDEWLVQAGLADVRWTEFVAVLTALFAVGFALAFALFGGALPAVVIGVFAATFPIASSRARRASRLATAQEAWPRMIEEIRIQTSALGRSIPQALFEVGRRGPVELRDAFEAAHREWLISTDFERTLGVLKSRLADPTADATCETLLIAHELGGSDLDRRLAALIDDRVLDAQGRKDARAKQSGVRFARRFVLLVPLGMALAGMSVGNGREAYRTASGQLLVLLGIGMVVACWLWAAQLMKLPEEQRVFSE
jgi:tight adherence protein B